MKAEVAEEAKQKRRRHLKLVKESADALCDSDMHELRGCEDDEAADAIFKLSKKIKKLRKEV